MANDKRIGLIVGAVASVAVIGGGVFAILSKEPELTEAERHFAETAASESGYCRGALSGVDCGCFGNTSAHILTGGTERALGTARTDSKVLARMQAQGKCS